MNKRRRFKAKRRRYFTYLLETGKAAPPAWVVQEVFKILVNHIETNFSRTYDMNWSD